MSDDDQKQGDPKDEKKGGKKKPSLKLAPNVYQIPKERFLSDKHRDELRASGITDEKIAEAELYTEINNAEIAKIMDVRSWARLHGNALVYPCYFPGETSPYGFRIKPAQPRVVGRKRDNSPKYAKYDQASSAGLLVYYPPGARKRNAYRDPTQTLYWTEGEKKGLPLDQLGYTTVAMTGVWNWIDAQHKSETGAERLHPRITDHVTIAGRHHVIVFDADARSNDQVMLAAGRLAGQLATGGAASIKFVCPTSKEHKGIDDYFAAFGEQITRQLLASAETIEPISPRDPLIKLKSLKSLRDAPISSDARLPPGYDVETRDGSLWKKAADDKHSDVNVARSPILIQEYFDDYYTGEGLVDVCFERDGRWISSRVSRKALVESRAMLTELAPIGAPVTSNNVNKIIDWLDDFERVNVGKVPRSSSVSRTGWHTIDSRRVFVLDKAITAAGDDVGLAIDTRGDRKKIFGALRSIADGKPDAERKRLEQGHTEALKRAWDADYVAAAMIAGALAAPLLEILGAANFGIHIPGDSSRGKTSMLKIAASIYGYANDENWLANWNITPVGAELRAATLNHLPQLYDEAGSGDQESIERLIYMLINGGGRARGNVNLQMRETPSWRTIVLSTGERSIADESAATGAQIRIIHLPVSKFGELGAEGVDAVREACVAHAGVFGRMWIEKLLDLDDPTVIVKLYKEATAELRKLAANDPLKGRLASYFAVLCVAEALAAQLGLGDPKAATMRQLFADEDGTRREEVRSVADRALDAAKDWIASEADAFPSLKPSTSGGIEPERKAMRVVHGYKHKGQVFFIPGQFRKWCNENNLSSREVVRGWKEKKWLDGESNRLDKTVRIGDTKSRFYVLSAHAFDDELLDFTPHPSEEALSETDGDEVSL